MEKSLKYGLVFNPADGNILVKGTPEDKIKGVEKEALKIVKKLMEKQLRSGERKIIKSEKGQWLAECDP